VRYLRSFGRFWWNFIVGDDWRLTAGVLLALAATLLLRPTGLPLWWLLPLTVSLLLATSLRRTTKSRD
jgi:hypothetical protein